MNDPHKQEIPDAPKQRLFGTWSKLGGGALTFAILAHVLVLTIGGIWIFQVIKAPDKKNDPPDFITGPKGRPTAEQVRTTPAKPAPIIPPNEVHAIIVKNGKTQLVMPESDNNGGTATNPGSLPGGRLPGIVSMVPDVRPGSSAGESAMDKEGAFRALDQPFSKRCSKEDRLQRIKDNGGTPACEDAVVKGLRWLKTKQAADGSWGEPKAAMTGFALLAYFGHCETTGSVEFGDTVQSGIVYLVNLGMKNNGRMAANFTENSWSYEHAIATYALAEAYTFCRELKTEIPNLREVTEKAGQFIIDNQHEKGGWAYLYAKKGGHADVSVAGWQIQALKACSHTGITYRSMVPCINRALKYLNSCQNANGGFGYTGPNAGGSGEYFTLTGVGMLCNQMWGQGPAEVRKGAQYVLQSTKFEYNTRFCDLYGHYYESQAMMQRGGDDWKQYNSMFRDQLLNNQDSDGSWKAPGGGAKDLRAVASSWVGNPVYRTCLCTLMLEVYYRFLSTGGGSAKERSGL